MKSILIKAFALLTVMAVLLTGCAATPEATEAPTEAPATEAPAASEEPAASEAPAASEEPAASTLSGELMITGSTSAEPLVTVFGDLFMEANPDVSVAVQGNGSSAGITAATNGTAQLGMSSRNLSEEEAAAEDVHSFPTRRSSDLRALPPTPSAWTALRSSSPRTTLSPT